MLLNWIKRTACWASYKVFELEKILQSSWDRGWKSIGATGNGHLLMNRIIAAYNEPHRKYHTQKHLTDCLCLFDKLYKLAGEPAIVEVALWFHDAIYNVKSNENEKQSADWAGVELQRAGAVQMRIERVKSHILATCHSALPQEKDQMLAVDIDLSILGSSRTRFKEYEHQIREEYDWVPDTVFYNNRRKMLTKLLLRDNIYSTIELREMFENQARDNIKYSLQQSQSASWL